jgi:hypothetical protein
VEDKSGGTGDLVGDLRKMAMRRVRGRRANERKYSEVAASYTKER